MWNVCFFFSSSCYFMFICVTICKCSSFYTMLQHTDTFSSTIEIYPVHYFVLQIIHSTFIANNKQKFSFEIQTIHPPPPSTPYPPSPTCTSSTFTHLLFVHLHSSTLPNFLFIHLYPSSTSAPPPSPLHSTSTFPPP